MSVITASLQTDGRLTLLRSGVFSVNERAERTGRNPRTGETMQITARKTVSTFRRAEKRCCPLPIKPGSSPVALRAPSDDPGLTSPLYC
ncbi:MAG TPA: hypothetical protein DCY27_09830 [Desulfobacterales bacterium]|nr:hypothetical protein [Desulfobacterales bacterium]